MQQSEVTAIKVRIEAQTVATLAGAMSFETSAFLLTLAEEPELLLNAYGPVVTIDPLLIAAARMVGEMMPA